MEEQYLIIVGTNRNNSNSRRVADYYQYILAQKGIEADILDLRLLPPDILVTALYENTGKNADFDLGFQQVISPATKLVYVIPEYNGSFPGVLKLFTDCLKFPDSLRGKKAALVGISSGTQGAALAISHYGDILSYLGVNVLGQRVRIPGIEGVLAEGLDNHATYKELLKLQSGLLMDF